MGYGNFSVEIKGIFYFIDREIQHSKWGPLWKPERERKKNPVTSNSCLSEAKPSEFIASGSFQATERTPLKAERLHGVYFFGYFLLYKQRK